MREIELTQGKFAMVDDSDFEWLNQWKWYAWKSKNTYYARRNTRNGNKRGFELMHKAIIISDKLIDHIDHNGLNNQRNNLRQCTNSQNMHNRIHNINSKSKYKGVSYSNSKKKWVAGLQINSKRISLGQFDTEIEAAKAYDIGAIKSFGDFAYLNFRTDYDLSNSNTNGHHLVSEFKKKASSKYKGVFHRKETNKYTASICINYKQIYLGQFDTEIEAAKAYDKAAMEYHGSDYPYFNFP